MFTIKKIKNKPQYVALIVGRIIFVADYDFCMAEEVDLLVGWLFTCKNGWLLKFGKVVAVRSCLFYFFGLKMMPIIARVLDLLLIEKRLLTDRWCWLFDLID